MKRTLWAVIALAFVFLSGLAAAEDSKCYELVRRLDSANAQERKQAETALIEIGKPAVQALVAESCQNLFPSKQLTAATLRILSRWEADSWTNSKGADAVDEFVRLARVDPLISNKHRPLELTALAPFAEHVRVLDVSPQEAKTFLESRGANVDIDSHGRTYVDLNSWKGDAKDWMYIANLATSDPESMLYISIGRYDVNSVFLTECLKYLKKARHCRVGFTINRPTLNRDGLKVLSTYQSLDSLWTHNSADGVTDDDFADAIAHFHGATAFSLPREAGVKAIAAAAKIKSLDVFRLRNESLTAKDLEPLLGHAKLRVLSVFDGRVYREYLNADEGGNN